MPGVTSASITDWLPLNFNRKTADAYPEGYVPQLHESMEVRRADVSAGYFDTLSIPILQGRAFTRDDSETAPRVIVVDETAANRYWPRQNPIGRRLNAYGRWYTVVGVARNSKHQRSPKIPSPSSTSRSLKWETLRPSCNCARRAIRSCSPQTSNKLCIRSTRACPSSMSGR